MPSKDRHAKDLPVHRIEMPTPYAVGPVNAYLIDSSPRTLIDCGINTPEAQRAMLDGLAAAKVAPESIEQILITHAHPDHYGLVGFIQDLSGATARLPAREIARVRDRQMMFAVGKLLLEAGMPLDLLFKMDQQRKEEPSHRLDHDKVVPIEAGDVFAFDGFELHTLHMPGHTGGHVVFFEPDSRALFAGDELLPEVSPNPLLEPNVDEPTERRHSLKEYLASLEAMAEMDLALVYPGHGDPVTAPHELITSTIEHHLKRKASLAARLGSEAKTPYELAQEIYPRVTGYDTFLSVSEVVAHLDLVVEDGDAVVEERDGVTYYRSAAA